MLFRTSASTSDRPPTPRPNPSAAAYVSDWQLFPDDPDEGIYSLADAETETREIPGQTVAP